jgi:hypothetical protein
VGRHGGGGDPGAAEVAGRVEDALPDLEEGTRVVARVMRLEDARSGTRGRA